jgi:hypothetical protein
MDLKSFTDSYSNAPKVKINELEPGALIYIVTENSVYELLVTDPKSAKVIARGGYFHRRKKEPCETIVAGSTMGGSMIFLYQVIEGLICEFQYDVRTSFIQKVYVYPPKDNEKNETGN